MTQTNHPNGFSLIELILIVMLVGIFAVMMIPFFNSGVGGSGSMLIRQQNLYDLNSEMAEISAYYEANYASDLEDFKDWLDASGVRWDPRNVLDEDDGTYAGLLVTVSSPDGEGKLVCLFTEKE